MAASAQSGGILLLAACSQTKSFQELSLESYTCLMICVDSQMMQWEGGLRFCEVLGADHQNYCCCQSA